MKRFEDLFGRILEACGAVSAFLAFAVAALVTLNVILRDAFGWRVTGEVEISEYILLLMTVSAAPWLLHKGQHVRIDLLLYRLPAPVAWMCEMFSDILGFLVSLLMTWYSIKVLVISILDGTKVVKEFTIPEWWTLVPLAVMFVLIGIEFVFRFLRLISGPRRVRNEGATI